MPAAVAPAQCSEKVKAKMAVEFAAQLKGGYILLAPLWRHSALLLIHECVRRALRHQRWWIYTAGFNSTLKVSLFILFLYAMRPNFFLSLHDSASAKLVVHGSGVCVNLTSRAAGKRIF